MSIENRIRKARGAGIISRLGVGPVKYSDQLIQHALKLAEQIGAKAASEATGIPHETMRKYARRGRREVRPVG